MSENKIADPMPLADSDENFDKSMKDIFLLMDHYESMVIQIQVEAKKFLVENQSLKENLAAIIEENNRLKTADKDDFGAFRNDHIAASDRIFNNLRNQIFLINQEKEMFETLWKKTAFVLEKEVPINSITKLKTDHSLEIKRLKEELITVTSNYERQNKINKILQTNAKMLIDKLESLQSSHVKLIDKLKKTESEKEELEKCFEESNELNKEQMKKATESFQKLQETIKLADETMAELQVLSQEKQQMEEECDSLARTIGSVMEAASEKIEREVEEIKERHRKEIADSLMEIERLGQMLELEKAKTNSAIQQANASEEKLKSIESSNTFLGTDLQAVMQTVIDTEAKILSMKNAVEKEKQANKLCQFEVGKLEKIIANNRQSKEKWKKLLIEITKKLEEKTKHLVMENQELRSSK